MAPNKTRSATQLCNLCSGYANQKKEEWQITGFQDNAGQLHSKNTRVSHRKKKDNIVQISFIPMQVYTVPGWRWTSAHKWIPEVGHINMRPQLHLWLLPTTGKPGETYTGLYSRQRNASCTGLWIKPSCSKRTYLN